MVPEGAPRKDEAARPETINLAAKLASFSDHWSPRTVAQFNGHDVMVAKVLGEFVWHKHDDTDDFFLVVKGRLQIELRDRTVSLDPGELFIVPKGVEHRPVAVEECHILLLEPLTHQIPATLQPPLPASLYEGEPRCPVSQTRL
jgi:mannose-6-phosphate isomerase-like protein (cupin superfamily)